MKVSRLRKNNLGSIADGSQIVGLVMTKRLNYSQGFGFGCFGGAKYGDSRRVGGIYQRRRKGYNQWTGRPPAGAPIYFVKMRSYQPTNPNTLAQQAQRTKFADAHNAWHALTDEEKRAYNERASKRSRKGYSLFMSEYLRSH